MDRYEDYNENVFIQEDEPKTFRAELKPKPFGDLAVNSNPTGADLFIDDQKKGVTPTDLENLPKGTHKVVLKKEGFELREAANGVSALEIVQGGYEPDVVITDVVMPGPVQGTDLVRRLKQKLPQTQFVVLSGYASQADNLGELSLERVVFQQKPVRMQQLVSIVKGVLANAE